jgi:transposase
VPRRWEDLKSNRQRDVEMTLARTHARAKNKRGNATHEATTRLIAQHDVVVIEKLHVKGMMQFGHLGRSIADVCPGEFRRQMVYKGAWKGTTVILASANFPSTQKCSRCGHIRKEQDKLTLRERTYMCPRCGLSIGRDLNSARNLEHYGRREMASRREEAVSRAIRKWWDGPGPSAIPGPAQDSLNREAGRPAADLVGAIAQLTPRVASVGLTR